MIAFYATYKHLGKPGAMQCFSPGSGRWVLTFTDGVVSMILFTVIQLGLFKGSLLLLTAERLISSGYIAMHLSKWH